jgi:hypothetical protein
MDANSSNKYESCGLLFCLDIKKTQTGHKKFSHPLAGWGFFLDLQIISSLLWFTP